MDIVKLCLKMGASAAESIAVKDIVFSPELRGLCEQNACGQFGSNYTCPPNVGEVNGLVAKLKVFEHSVIWQNIYSIEDSFDFEGMMDAQRRHNEMTRKIAGKVYEGMGRENVIILAAGGCSLCEPCAMKTDEPCPYPDEALPSLEAHGINVSVIGEISGMKYINGKDTVTYFSGVFF